MEVREGLAEVRVVEVGEGLVARKGRFGGG